MHLSDGQKEKFEENGYLLIKNVDGVMSLINNIHDEVCALAKCFMPDYTQKGAAKDIAALPAARRKSFYNGLRYLPSVTQLACSNLLLGISQELSLLQPAVMHSYNLRMDMPSEPDFLFHWHQDITYLLGSKNSVTYWVPLTPVDEFQGSIEIIEGSHKQGLLPFHYTGEGPPPARKPMSPSDIRLDSSPTDAPTLIEADPGDIIVFSQFLLHRSTANHSDQVRWVSQVRHSDFAEVDFRNAGFPFGDSANIFENHYLK